jgi:putative MATE family efflux protein
MVETKHRASLTEGPIGHTLFRLSVPMFFGIFSAIAFNIVDTFFVGQLGTLQLAAMSFTFPVVSLIGGLSLGLGAGASAIISRAIGRGDHQEVQRLTSDSLVLSLLIVVFFVIIGLLTMDQVFYLMGATPDIMDMVKDYMRIWYPGMAFIIIPMVGNNALRATGDTKTPMKIMLVSFIINLVLDPLLIFGLGPFPD